MSVKGTRRSVILKRRSSRYGRLLVYVRRFGKILIFILFISWLGAWFFLSDGVTKIREWSINGSMEMASDMGFAVEKILVEGRNNTDADTLKAIINIDKHDSIFLFKPDKARELIEKISWVKSARVERRLPDTIYIGLTERQPFALWQREGSLALIDDEGRVLCESGLEPFANMIIVVGEDANKHASELLPLIHAEPDIENMVDSATWVSGRRWDLRLANGIDVRLPEKDVALSLRRLASAEAEGKILEKSVEYIDLRKSDRIIVRPKSGEAQSWDSAVSGSGREQGI